MVIVNVFTQTFCHKQDATQGHFFSGLNSYFSFVQTGCLSTENEPSLTDYSPIAVGRRDRFMPYPSDIYFLSLPNETVIDK